MTVNTTNITSGPYSGNDVTTSFSYDFRIEDESQLIVYETDDAGVETTLVLNTDYTVSGVGSDSGGNVTRSAGALPTGYTWYIRSDYEETQETSFISQGAFLPAVHEAAMDKITFLIQQISDKVGRALRFSDSYSGSDPGTIQGDVNDYPGYYVAINNTGDGYQLIAPMAASTNSSILSESYVATAGQTIFNLVNSYSEGVGSLKVYINGVKQINNSSYTETDSTTVTFVEGLDAGDVVEFNIGVMDVNSVSLAANVTYTPAGTGAVATNVQTKLRETVSVKDFGATGDGVTDDTAAIQAAVDTGLDVFFPSGKYLISSTITVDTRGQALYGHQGSVPTSKGEIDSTERGAILKWSLGAADPADYMFHATQQMVTFSYLHFAGITGQTNDYAILFQSSSLTNSDDMDGYVQDCDFTYMQRGIYFVNRALSVQRCVFASCATPIILDWDDTYTAGGDMQTNDLYKGRAHRICDNRFHVSGPILIQNFIARGIVIANNMMDVGNQFISVDGGTDSGISGGVISGNTINMPSFSSCIRFEEGTICRDVTISDNNFSGALADLVDGTSRMPFAHMIFDGCSEITGLNITSNVFSATDANAISFINDVAATPITPSQINISNNMFKSIGNSGTNRSVVVSVYDVDDFMFNNNIVYDDGTSLARVVDIQSSTATNITMRNNLFDSALDAVTGTLTGFVNVEEYPATFRTNSSGGFVLGNSGATSSTLLYLYRLDSAGGVGTHYENSAGDFEIFGIPDGADTGTLIPSGDGGLGLGDTGNAWKYVQTKPIIVANLPTASASTGQRYIVTDATATTFNSTVTGGGSNIVPVFSNGTNWVIG